MAQRRNVDYRKRRRRRRRRNALATIFAMCIIIGAIIAAITTFFKVTYFNVSGNTIYSTQEIINSTGIQMGDNMFAVNKFEVANKILREFPYIGEVKIRRRLPDTFNLEITERKKTAWIQTESFKFLIDKNLYVLESMPLDSVLEYPQVVGVKALVPAVGTKLAIEEAESLRLLEILLKALEDNELIAKTSVVDLTKIFNLTINYDKRFIIEFGTDEQMDKKIRMLKAVLNELEDTDRGIINVSDPKQARFRPDVNIEIR